METNPGTWYIASSRFNGAGSGLRVIELTNASASNLFRHLVVSGPYESYRVAQKKAG